MRAACTRRTAISYAFLSAILAVFLSGCGFFQGFGLLESPLLYYLPVNTVATRVACELEDFIDEHSLTPAIYGPHEKWVLADQDISVTLTLTTDESGTATFTGVDVARLGFTSLAAFITSTTSGKTTVPSLQGKVNGKRTRTVAIQLTVSPKDLRSDHAEDTKCKQWRGTESPIMKLYLRDWLNNFFEVINAGTGSEYIAANNPNPDITDNLLHIVKSKELTPAAVPTDFKMQSVDLSSSLLLLGDISAGATPNFLGNGTAYVVPINGLSLDYSPDYSDKIDIKMNICNNTPVKVPGTKHEMNENPCYDANKKVISHQLTPLLVKQCQIYSWLLPLLPNVMSPKDVKINGTKEHCDPKTGVYVAEVAMKEQPSQQD